MIRGASPALEWVDSCIARAREVTRRRLSSRWFKRLRKGKERFRPLPVMSRRDAFRRMREASDDRAAQHERAAHTPVETANWYEYEQRHAALEVGYLWAETRATREVIHARVRDFMASALDRLAASPAATQERSYYCTRAERLRKARRRGAWGYHRVDGSWKMFFRDRSGLVLFDPSEARREQARQVRRLLPVLQAEYQRGRHIYAGVLTMPNAKPGELAAAKRAIQRRFRQAILGRSADGRCRRNGGAFPEVVGAYTIQEDPLSKRRDWNLHVNVLFAVDPKLCTPLDPELELQLPPGPRPRNRTPPGLLCYKKLHYVWGHQLKFRKIEARNDAALEKAIIEAIKYRAKWISAKHLEQGAARPGAARRADREDQAGRDHGVRRNCNAGGAGDPGLRDGRALSSGQAAADLLAGQVREDQDGPGAPSVMEYTDPEFAEWIDANRGFRRARGYGSLYRLGKDPLAEVNESDYRIVGDVTVTPHGAIVTCTYIATPRPAPVSSIHGDKSGAIFPGSTGRSPSAQARAGPTTGEALA